jgi:hypothetical protein
VLIDCTKKSVKLTAPDGKELEFLVEPIVTNKRATNYGMFNQLDAGQGLVVPAVNKFSDVFLDVCHLTETWSL